MVDVWAHNVLTERASFREVLGRTLLQGPQRFRVTWGSRGKNEAPGFDLQELTRGIQAKLLLTTGVH